MSGRAHVVVITTFYRLNWLTRYMVRRRLRKIESLTRKQIPGFLWAATTNEKSGIVSITAWDSYESAVEIGQIDAHVQAAHWLVEAGGLARSECYAYLGHYTKLFELTRYSKIPLEQPHNSRHDGLRSASSSNDR
jgi:hypothetical protein